MFVRISRCGFLFLHPGEPGDLRWRKTFATPEFTMEIRGVASPEEGETAARELRDGGVQILDLCGGFDDELTARIVAAVEGKIAVGARRPAAGSPPPPDAPRRYGFIFKGPGMVPEHCQETFEAPGYFLEVRGVSSVEEGEIAAREMGDRGVTILGLCGGFNDELTARIMAAVGGKVAVGTVRYAPEEAAKISHLLGLPEA
ncbi:MAG TPA: DUF6506 family protein [Synergistaceae bacterium]|jgi:hypothetical protein|nr:DUF6506 family protein [Synergistaceae bacterium]HQF91027.1 DUF6506 family protein [Synergistaceae bacterium]HQH77526.1 DUF6506 family protein [Synergistaceae bacterium]